MEMYAGSNGVSSGGTSKQVDQCTEERGMKGMKMQSVAGFCPTDEVL